MRLSIIPDFYNLEESFEISKKYNTAFEYNDFFNPNVYLDDAEINKRIDNYNSLDRDKTYDTLHGVFYDVCFDSCDPNVKKYALANMEKSLEIAKRLSCKGVVFHTGIISSLKLESYFNRWVNEAEVVFRDLCNKYNTLEIYLENTTEDNPKYIVELSKRLSDVKNFKLCLDYAHAYLTNTNLITWAKEFSPYIGHIHLNDNDRLEDSHLSLGSGSIDISYFNYLYDKYLNNVTVLLEVKNNQASLDSILYLNNNQNKAYIVEDKSYDSNILMDVLNTTLDIARLDDKNEVLNLILNKSMELTNCDGGTIYALKDNKLYFKLMKTKSLGINRGTKGELIDLPPLELKETNVASYTCITGKKINIADVYKSDLFDFSGPKKYDAMTGYKTKSLLTIPLMDDKKKILGVMQLLNAKDIDGNLTSFDEGFEKLFEIMSAMAAITLTQTEYIEEINDYVKSFTKALAKAIDERTPYNGSHTRNVAKYSIMCANKINEGLDESSSNYFNKERLQALEMSAYLHDIGKMIVPTKVMNKATRLDANLDKVLARLDYILLKEHIKNYHNMSEYLKKEALINKTKELVIKANSVGFLDDGLLNELNSVLDLKYEDEKETISYFTFEEKNALTVRKGTLTAEERNIMESHVVYTDNILSEVTFKGIYKDVRKNASSHHEYLDGSGYPKHLCGNEINLEVRILAACDILDALLATDRPYKKAMPVDKAFSILNNMVKENKLDGFVVDMLYKAYMENVYEKEA